MNTNVENKNRVVFETEFKDSAAPVTEDVYKDRRSAKKAVASKSKFSGHRKRIRERYLAAGSLEPFSLYQILELLLIYSIPVKDVTPIARELAEKFGSLAAVLDASPDELLTVKGINVSTAAFFKLFNDVGRCYRISKTERRLDLTKKQTVNEYAAALMHGRVYETLCMICLDSKNCLKNSVVVAEGTIIELPVQIRKIVRTALINKAVKVILVHNHPDGLPIPSYEDVQTTKQIAEALRTIQTKLVDHIIIADEQSCSMVDENFI